MLNVNWLDMCQEATHEKDVLKTWNNVSLNLSFYRILMVPSNRISQNVGSRKSKSKEFVEKILLE